MSAHGIEVNFERRWQIPKALDAFFVDLLVVRGQHGNGRSSPRGTTGHDDDQPCVAVRRVELGGIDPSDVVQAGRIDIGEARALAIDELNASIEKKSLGSFAPQAMKPIDVSPLKSGSAEESGADARDASLPSKTEGISADCT